jgi:hypothetical protein
MPTPPRLEVNHLVKQVDLRPEHRRRRACCGLLFLRQLLTGTF